MSTSSLCQSARSRIRRPDDDAIPAPSPLLFRLFARYARRYMARHFHAVRISGPGPTHLSGLPAIVYLNHPSWWDPLTCIVLAERYFPRRSHYGPIDAGGLSRYPFLRRLGFFGIDPDTRQGAVDFLRSGRAILKNPNAMLWVTAQGKFTDPRNRPVRLRPGVAHLARQMDRVAILPLAIEYPFWQERTPEALVRFVGPFIFPDDADPAGATAAQLNQRLEHRLEQAQNELAAHASLRDPARFESILGGRAGVGGIYDAWRRAKALLAGRKFVAEHEVIAENRR